MEYMAEFEAAYNNGKNEGYKVGYKEGLVKGFEQATEVHSAKWIDYHVTDNGVAEELCGKCVEWTIGRNKRFCPNCGARMDGES